MMKSKDCAVATALVIQGYLRANLDDVDGLSEAIAAIRSECNDWAENLATHDQALSSEFSIELIEKGGGPVARSPENLINAAVALAAEAVDLFGPEAIALLIERVQAVRS